MKNKIKLFCSLLVFCTTLFAGSMNDDPFIIKTTLHKAEVRFNADNTSEQNKVIELEIFGGYDRHKVHAVFSVENADMSSTPLSEYDTARLHVYYSFIDDIYSDGLIGILHSFKGGGVDFVSIGYKALLPYYIDSQTLLYANKEGLAFLDVELEHEMMVTQKVILLFNAELSLASKHNEIMQSNSGLNHIGSGVRLIYAINKNIMPYVGVAYEKSYFKSNIPTDDESHSELSYIIGAHIWF